MNRRPRSSTENNRRRSTSSCNEPIQEQCPLVQEQCPPVQEQCPPVQEQCPRIVEEDESDCDDSCERYDPKELREAVKKISPFLRLLDERQNPYARVVAREICKIFYAVHYPDTDPCNIEESLKPILRGVKSTQVWTEFNLYLDPQASYKEWVKLCLPDEIATVDPYIDFVEDKDFAPDSPKCTPKRPGCSGMFRTSSKLQNQSRRDDNRDFQFTGFERNDQFPIIYSDTDEEEFDPSKFKGIWDIKPSSPRHANGPGCHGMLQNRSKLQSRSPRDDNYDFQFADFEQNYQCPIICPDTNEQQCSSRQSPQICDQDEQQCSPRQAPECSGVTNYLNTSQDLSCMAPPKSGTSKMQFSPRQSPPICSRNEEQCSSRQSPECSGVMNNLNTSQDLSHMSPPKFGTSKMQFSPRQSPPICSTNEQQCSSRQSPECPDVTNYLNTSQDLSHMSPPKSGTSKMQFSPRQSPPICSTNEQQCSSRQSPECPDVTNYLNTSQDLSHMSPPKSGTSKMQFSPRQSPPICSTNEQQCSSRQSPECSGVTNNLNNSPDLSLRSPPKSSTNKVQFSPRQSPPICSTNEQQCSSRQPPECPDVTNYLNTSQDLSHMSPPKSGTSKMQFSPRQSPPKCGTNEQQCSPRQSPPKCGTNEHQCSPRRSSRSRCPDINEQQCSLRQSPECSGVTNNQNNSPDLSHRSPPKSSTNKVQFSPRQSPPICSTNEQQCSSRQSPECPDVTNYLNTSQDLSHMSPPKSGTSKMQFSPRQSPPKCGTNEQQCSPRQSPPKCGTNEQQCSPRQSPPKCGTNEHQCSPRRSSRSRCPDINEQQCSPRQSPQICDPNEQQCSPRQSPECSGVTNNQNNSPDLSHRSPPKSSTNEHQWSPRRENRPGCSGMSRNRSKFRNQSPRDDTFDYQFAGSDALPCDVRHSEPDFGKAVHSSSKYTYDEETDGTGSESMSEDSFGESEIDEIALTHAHSNRQYAGNDDVNNCDPSSTTWPSTEMIPNSVENPANYEYYSVIGNSRSPRQNDSGNTSQYSTPCASPMGSPLRTDGLTSQYATPCASPMGSNGSATVNPDIICNANVVADAFTNISVAQQELDKKKKEFTELTETLMAPCKNDEEAPPCTNADNQATNIASKRTTPQKIMPPFSDSEWNYNAFADRDFVKLLPFYEMVHNQLEYISRRQREYGVNMLDDIMPVFYHIHYDLGDPRLKNELLVEHVKLITKNTWEAFFYPRNKRMPAIPKRQQPVCLDRSRPNADLEQHLSPRQLDLRDSCPKPPNQIPSILTQARCPSISPQLDPCFEQRAGPSCPDTSIRFRNPSPEPVAGPSCPDTSRRPTNPSPGPVAGPSCPDTSRRPTNPCPQEMAGPSRPDTSRRLENPCPEQGAGPSRADTSRRNRNPCQDQAAGPLRTTTSKKSRTGRSPEVPQQTEAAPVVAKKSFLRRSQPSGAPKTWAPKLKAQERPPDAKVFKAKPLPKFVRDRLNSRDGPC